MAGSSVIGALRVNLGVDSAQFSTGLKKANADIASFQKSIAGMAAQLGGALAGAFTVKAMAGMADQWSDMSSRVGVAVKSMQAAPEIMERISKIANMTYSPLSQTADGFIENNASMRELGYTTNQVLDYTEAMNNALVVSGAKGERAASVQRALSVAMSTGKLSGDGLNSVLSNGGRIAEALAKELGTSRNGLIALGSKGKITADIIGKTLLKEMEALREEAASMPATIGDGFTLIGNSIASFVGRLDQATGASANIAAVLASVADAITNVADFVIANSGAIASALQLIASTAAVVGVAIATKYVAVWAVGFVAAARAALTQSIALEMALGAQSRAAAAAGIATKALSGALGLLKTAAISSVIGGLVIGAGYLISKFLDLVKATGGWGNALSLLGEVASGVWEGIKTSASAIAPALNGVWKLVEGAFAGMLGSINKKWSEFLVGLGSKVSLLPFGIGEGYSAPLFEMASKADAAVQGFERSAKAAKEEASAFGKEASTVAVNGFDQAAAALSKLTISVDETTDSLGDPNGGGGGGLIDSLDKTGDKTKGAKEKISDLDKVMKALREEAEKLKATLWMTNLDADIWEKQREAGVQANSVQGQRIAGYLREIDGMKRLKAATEEWKDSISSAFSSFITQGGSFKKVLSDIIGKLAEMMMNRAFESLWATKGGGGFLGGAMKLLGFSNGTNFAPGGLARVNERGGEIMNLPRGTQVIPNDISKRMADNASKGQGGTGGAEIIVRSDPGVIVEVARGVVRQERGSIARDGARLAAQSSQKTKSAFGVR